MKTSVRQKLFFGSLALIIVACGATVGWLEPQLRVLLQEQVEGELKRMAFATRDLILKGDNQSPPLNITTSTLAEQIGASTDLRVTIVASDGQVLADSDVSQAALSSLEPHHDRPEVVAAQRDGYGRAMRYSTTVGQEFLYVAVPFETTSSKGTVRVARSLEQVDEITNRLWTLLALAGLIGLSLAAFLSAVASSVVSRAIRRVIDYAESVTDGESSRAVVVSSADDSSLLSRQLRDALSEIGEQVEKLARERDRFRTVLDVMQAAVIAVDGQRSVTLVNSAAARLLELPPEPVGRNVVELVRVPALHTLLETAVRDQQPVFSEVELPGEFARTVIVGVAPYSTAEGMVIVVNDVSKLRHLETVRRDFVANVSHELRTPLSVIRANTETLLDGALTDEAAGPRFLDSIQRNATRLTNLVSDLLDLTRIESGAYDLECEPVLLAGVVDSVVDSVVNKIVAQEQTLKVDVSRTLAVNADHKALEQVLINLVENASRYTQVGGTISIQAEESPDHVRLSVTDNGPGIPLQHRERLFERFYRVDPGRSRELGGTGLGLSIVKHLVGSMGGRVDMEPNIPGGSVFFCELAVAQLAPSMLADESTSYEAAPSSDGAAAAQPSTPLRVVEESNSPAIRDLMKAVSSGGVVDRSLMSQEKIQERLLLMAGRVEVIIAEAMRALLQRDEALAQETIESDHAINQDEIDLDAMCLGFLARGGHSPEEVRFVTLTLKTVTDLERIADMAVNIAERATDLSRLPSLGPLVTIPLMGQLVGGMVRDAIDAFVARDVPKALDVIERDDELDEAYHSIFRRLLAIMMEDTDAVERGVHIQSVAKYLERMGDHATNLAEQVIYLSHGTDVRHYGKL